MEFDINKVYTAVNADEVKIGSKCFYEWNFKSLKKDVENNNEKDIGIVTEIYDEGNIYRFQIDNWIDREAISDGAFALIYLIEPPKESQYKPFSSIKKAKEIIEKHGGWISRRGGESYFLITGYVKKFNEEDRVYIPPLWRSLQELNNDYVFVDDGTPCGELMEE